MISTELDIKKYFICNYCKLIVENPYEKECCGGLVCFDCSNYYRDLNTVCSVCLKKYSFRKNCFAKRLLHHMNISCIYDCGFSSNYDKIRQHTLHCEQRIFHCDDCGFQGNRKSFKMHYIDAHEEEFFDMYEYNTRNNKGLLRARKEKKVSRNVSKKKSQEKKDRKNLLAEINCEELYSKPAKKFFKNGNDKFGKRLKEKEKMYETNTEVNVRPSLIRQSVPWHDANYNKKEIPVAVEFDDLSFNHGVYDVDYDSTENVISKFKAERKLERDLKQINQRFDQINSIEVGTFHPSNENSFSL